MSLFTSTPPSLVYFTCAARARSRSFNSSFRPDRVIILSWGVLLTGARISQRGPDHPTLHLAMSSSPCSRKIHPLTAWVFINSNMESVLAQVDISKMHAPLLMVMMCFAPDAWHGMGPKRVDITIHSTAATTCCCSTCCRKKLLKGRRKIFMRQIQIVDCCVAYVVCAFLYPLSSRLFLLLQRPSLPASSKLSSDPLFFHFSSSS